MKRLRAYLIAGLLVWIPIGVTIFVVRLLNGLMDRSLVLLPERLQPEQWLGFAIPGLGIVLTFVLLIVTGFLAANFVGRGMVGLWESLLQRIPIVRSVYSASKNFAEVVFSEGNESFKKVLLVEYPRKGVYSLAFQTASTLGEVQARTGEEVVCTFVPTTPNPTSGFIVMMPRSEIIELDMAVDDALKMIFSLGVVVPTWPADQVAEFLANQAAGRPRDDDVKP
jgi:uncharacterized membrane protein